MKPYPLNTVNFRKPSAQLGKAALTVKICAVAGDILRNDDELLNAVLGKLTSFFNNILNFSRTVSAPYVRNCAEGAEIVAALGNAQIRPAWSGANDPRCFLNGGIFVAKS